MLQEGGLRTIEVDVGVCEVLGAVRARRFEQQNGVGFADFRWAARVLVAAREAVAA